MQTGIWNGLTCFLWLWGTGGIKIWAPVCHLLKTGDFVNTSVRNVLHCLQSVGAAECFSKGLCKRSEMDEVKGHCSAHPNGLYSSLMSHNVITKTQYVHQYQCWWEGGGGEAGTKWCPASNYVAYVFIFLRITICWLYKSTLSDQALVTLQLRVSLSNLVSRFLASPPLLQGPKKIFSHGPEYTLRSPYQYCNRNWFI
jgi:hypothetical protein